MAAELCVFSLCDVTKPPGVAREVLHTGSTNGGLFFAGSTESATATLSNHSTKQGSDLTLTDANTTTLFSPFSEERVTSHVTVLLNFLLSFVICSGNALTLAAIYKTHRLQTQPNFYIASLALADIIVGLVVFVRGFSYIQDTHRVFTFSPYACLTYLSLLYTSIAASIFSIVAVSLDRVINICFCLLYETLMTPRMTIGLISVTWLLALVYGTVPLYTSHPARPLLRCVPTQVLARSYFLHVNSVTFLLSCIVIIVCYAQIARVFLRHRQSIMRVRPRNVNKPDARTGPLEIPTPSRLRSENARDVQGTLRKGMLPGIKSNPFRTRWCTRSKRNQWERGKFGKYGAELEMKRDDLRRLNGQRVLKCPQAGVSDISGNSNREPDEDHGKNDFYTLSVNETDLHPTTVYSLPLKSPTSKGVSGDPNTSTSTSASTFRFSPDVSIVAFSSSWTSESAFSNTSKFHDAVILSIAPIIKSNHIVSHNASNVARDKQDTNASGELSCNSNNETEDRAQNSAADYSVDTQRHFFVNRLESIPKDNYETIFRGSSDNNSTELPTGKGYRPVMNGEFTTPAEVKREQDVIPERDKFTEPLSSCDYNNDRSNNALLGLSRSSLADPFEGSPSCVFRDSPTECSSDTVRHAHKLYNTEDALRPAHTQVSNLIPPESSSDAPCYTHSHAYNYTHDHAHSHTHDHAHSHTHSPPPLGPDIPSRLRAARLLAMVCGVFLACWTPLILSVLAFYTMGGTFEAISACTTVAVINSAINFFIYAAANKDFRHAFKVLLCRR